MKILIVSTIVPFIKGGGTFIVDWLDQILKKYGHESEVIKIPFHSYAPEMVEQMLALRLLDVKDYADLLIAVRYPSYVIDHPNKVLWLLHQFRQIYDLWGTPHGDIPCTPENQQVRETIIQSDNLYLRQAKKIYTISKVVSGRLKRYNDIDSEVLYPPLMDAQKYRCQEAGDYLFYPSRITTPKRQYLAIESMKYTRSKAKLIIAGSPDTPEQLDHINSIVEKNHLQNKVKIIGNWISQDEKIDLFANALGCLFIPYEEDYGYVTLEAYYSRKPVITCSDSGGVVELVEDGVTGKIVPPEPKAIAEAIDSLFFNRAQAAKLGQAGYQKLSSMNISWDRVVEKITG